MSEFQYLNPRYASTMFNHLRSDPDNRLKKNIVHGNEPTKKHVE